MPPLIERGQKDENNDIDSSTSSSINHLCDDDDTDSSTLSSLNTPLSDEDFKTSTDLSPITTPLFFTTMIDEEI